jgi:hypothetical protein
MLTPYYTKEGGTSPTSIGQCIGGRLSSSTQGVLRRVNVAGAPILSTVGVGSGGVTDLLGSGLLAVWLECAGNLVRSTGDVLGEDLSGGFLRLRGDLLPDLLTKTFTPMKRQRICLDSW